MAEDQRLTPGAGSLPIAASTRVSDTLVNYRMELWGFDGANWNRLIVNADGSINGGGGGGGGGTVTQGPAGVDPWLVLVTNTVAVTGPLTDAELRATPVDVLGPLTDTELRASPVPVSAAQSGSWTVAVSGTVAVTQSGSWTITANQGTSPWVVGDGGDSLTVDQATHDNLNANANIQVGNTDVANGNPVPVSDAGGVLTVDGTVTADTELETPAALADGQGNPTLPRIGSIVLQAKYVDGTITFDRRPHSYYQNRTGAGNTSGAGTTIDMTTGPCSKFALYVENGTGTTSAWNINLEGSFAGSDWVIVGNNTSATGAAQAVWVTERPVRFVRSNVVTVTGGGTCRVRILASQD